MPAWDDEHLNKSGRQRFQPESPVRHMDAGAMAFKLNRG
jgi:hypothetical protein